MPGTTVIFDLYGTLVDLSGRPLPGVAELVADLAAAGAGLAVATSDRASHARAVLAAMGVERHFVSVCGARPPMVRSKADIVADALECLGLPDPDAVAMVGDRPQDMEAAVTHGLVPLGVPWGASTAGELARTAGVRVVKDVAELRRVLSGFVADARS